MIRMDLHTHSEGSPDGSLSLEDYRHVLANDILNVIAITDHDSIDFALQVHKTLGAVIIVGEEITTRDGELIGLYLTERIAPGLSVQETAKAIKKQHGLVYVPHPFETVRHGLPIASLNEIADYVDIIEVHSGRAVFQNKGAGARAWAAQHKVAMAASSDAHGRHGWGKTTTTVSHVPECGTLTSLLIASDASLQTKTVGLRGILYPKRNRMRRRLRNAS